MRFSRAFHAQDACTYCIQALLFSFFTNHDSFFLFLQALLFLPNRVIIPKHLQIVESTYTRVIPLMMQFLVLKCVSTYTRGRLIHEYIRYIEIFVHGAGNIESAEGSVARVCFQSCLNLTVKASIAY